MESPVPTKLSVKTVPLEKLDVGPKKIILLTLFLNMEIVQEKRK
jgi:hypothetical protein